MVNLTVAPEIKAETELFSCYHRNFSSIAMSTGEQPKTVKKKVYNVSSRYLQVPGRLSSREKSSVGNSKELSAGNFAQDISSSSKLSSQSGDGMTSTPMSKSGVFFPMLDASVTDSQPHFAMSLLKERIVPTPADSRKIMKQEEFEQAIARGPIIASHKDKKSDSFDEEEASDEMDLLYATYLQSAFLLSEAQKALEETSANAEKTLHKLWTLVLLHLHKAKSQSTLLKTISILIEVHDHCQKQEEMLKPVFEVLPALDEQYRSLAEAINVTKHKLLVKDLILPEDEQDIQKILQKMSNFIVAFFEAFPLCKEIITSSDVLKNYVDSGELLTDALERGVSLLTEAQDLCISEASLSLGCDSL